MPCASTSHLLQNEDISILFNKEKKKLEVAFFYIWGGMGRERSNSYPTQTVYKEEHSDNELKTYVQKSYLFQAELSFRLLWWIN